MKHTIAAVLVLCLALPARSQEVMVREPPPPPPDDAQVSPPLRTSEVGYLEGCFGAGRTGVAPLGIYGEVPIPIGGQSSDAGPAISGLKDDKAWLFVAVLAAAALPIVIYAVDRPAPRLVLQHFRCPTMALDLLGGADNGHAALGRGSYGLVSTRLTLGAEHIGADFQYDAAAGSVSAFSTHLLLRVTPRDHVEGGLALGYRRSVLGNRRQEGLEVGLPHRYALWRDGLQTVALEVRPLLLLGTRIEPSLETVFVFPLADVLHARIGGRVYTFAGDLLWGLLAGFSLTL